MFADREAGVSSRFQMEDQFDTIEMVYDRRAANDERRVNLGMS